MYSESQPFCISTTELKATDSFKFFLAYSHSGRNVLVDDNIDSTGFVGTLADIFAFSSSEVR